MKRRAALARSLALDPQIIIYDEPSAGLDPIIGDEIGQLIRGLQTNLGVTSVVVTHDLRLAEQIADRVALLFEGRLVFVGTYQEFIQSPNQEARRFLHRNGGEDAPG
jgi:phospholipid/cholesterol/gamma-HCH transport system ATP-binding protein